MKIEVGKTYKSADGREWLVEGKLVQEPNEGYPYIVTSVDRDYNFVNEAGQIRNRRYARDCDLLPNKVKKTYWIALGRVCPVAFYYSTLAAARAACPMSSGYAEVSFEVEES